MSEFYTIEGNDLFKSVFTAMGNYRDKHNRLPELVTISPMFGETIARALSAGLLIAVTLDDIKADRFMLSMLPEDNHE